MAYDRGTPHQLCQFHLLREYKRDIGKVGFSQAKALLRTDDMERAREYACRIVALPRGKAEGVALARQGIAKRIDASTDGRRVEIPRDVAVGAVQSGDTGRARMGTAWTVHNLLALLQMRGVLA